MKKITLLATASMMTLSMAVCGGQIVGASESSDENLVYGTATLTYSEFYAGDVSSVESYDAVSSATFSKYEIMPNMDTDFVDETSNADGYHIIGVKNVSVAVAESDLEAYQALNPTFVAVENEPQQYKLVTMEDGTAVYSETQFNVADTVTDATAELVTGGTWGDYQINVTDGETVHLRNSREDEFDINSEIQGIILETASGLKVGMEYLQSIWVQPYEVSFNVLDDNSHNTHIAAYDNLDELSKLVGETVVKITYIMPEETYVYEFDGIYIKPIYSEAITATTAEDFSSVTLSADNFDAFDNGTLTVNYTLGSGRDRQIITLLETALVNGASEYAVDLTALSDAETGGIYSAVISSDSYADIVVSLPASQEQKEALEALVSTAQEKLNEDAQNTTLEEHMNEAQEMLENEAVSSSEMGSLISELTQLTSDEEEQERSGH